jgi:DNA-binding HxlR family transcriptional regulator
MYMTVLQGGLAERDTWSAVGHCPIEKTMALVGTKSAMLIMREAYYGTTRFDDFARRVGITKAATSARRVVQRLVRRPRPETS